MKNIIEELKKIVSSKAIEALTGMEQQSNFLEAYNKNLKRQNQELEDQILSLELKLRIYFFITDS